jgi:hypothetical protein
MVCEVSQKSRPVARIGDWGAWAAIFKRQCSTKSNCCITPRRARGPQAVGSLRDRDTDLQGSAEIGAVWGSSIMPEVTTDTLTGLATDMSPRYVYEPRYGSRGSFAWAPYY